MRDLEDYRIALRTPENCVPTECDLFVGIDTNAGDSDWLDVHIQGNADTWVAVGFSETNNMVKIGLPTHLPTYPPSPSSVSLVLMSWAAM